MIRNLLPGLAAVCAAALPGAALADEGMWTFDNVPAARIQQSLGVSIDKPWLDHLQAASVRLTSGCSASVVSAQGLALTNAHCVMDCLQNLSGEGRDYFKDGFSARTRDEELQCPGMQAEVLVEIDDVTARVQAATAGRTGAAFVAARDSALGAAEKHACRGEAGHRCQAVNFYRGGQYKVHRYRRYDDVRLAFAPEFSTAFFGGDPDNFNFPRFNLDAAFLRLYDKGRVARTPAFLRWSATAPAEGEATFVSGNPGSTERLLTVSQLQSLRDLAIPVGQLQRSELRGRLIEFGRQGEEQRRIAAEPLFGLENSFKVFFGRQFVLNDKALIDAKLREEVDLVRLVADHPTLAGEIGDPWTEMDDIQRAYADHYLEYRQLESEAGKGSRLFAYARALVRGAQERARPDAERLPEWVQSRLPLEEKRLLDAKPVHPALERIYLEHWLLKTREYLTVDAPAARTVLGRESPEGLAQRLVEGSRLADPAVRKRLWNGGLKAVEASDDPLIAYVLATDPDARRARATWEEKVSGPTDRAAERIARARFAVLGDSVYPDATFSPRLSYGRVRGWTHRGATVAPFTTIAGLYDRATGAAPYALSPSWVAAKDRLDKDIVFNFVTDNDIIGGNSGSPVVNARGEVVGTAFDGNIHSLGGAYGYDGTLNRMVVVSAAAIVEALDKVYARPDLVAELTGR